MRWLKKALGRTGRKAAEELVTRGYIASKEGRLDDAVRAYRDACDADPNLAVAFFDAATAELACLNRDAAALDPAGRQARLASAEALLERAVALDATHAPSWRSLARVRERRGAMLSAHAAWTTVVGLLTPAAAGAPAADPEALAEARREQARLQPAARLEEAIARAKDALAQPSAGSADPADARLAALDAMLAAWEVARLANVPEPPHILALAGSLARKAGDLPRARALLEEATQKDKHDVEAWRELATVCMATNDMTAALTASMAAYRENPVDAGLVCNVGVCHLALGDRDKAREFIELAHAMAPKDPIVQRAVAALSPV